MENTHMSVGAIVRSLVSEGCAWTIYEQPPMHAHQQNALIFMSDRIARRVSRYPRNWFELPDDMLAEIGTRA